MVEPGIRDLRILLAMLEERDVARGASKLDVPSLDANRALDRMRGYLDDPLLIDADGDECALSDRALRVVPQLRSILAEVAALREMNPDAPTQINQQFKICMPDYLTMLLLPELINVMAVAAPGASLLVSDSGQRVYGRLQFGDIDVAVEVLPSAGPGFISKPMFDWPLLCVMGADNPLANAPLTAENYAAAKHGLVTMAGNGTGIIDTALAELGLSRNVVVIARQFSSVPMLAERSELLFALPEPVAHILAERHNLVVCELPVQVPILNFGAVWHSRTESEPEQAWFHKVLEICCAQVALRYQ